MRSGWKVSKSLSFSPTEADLGLELLRGAHGVLTDHRVDHEKHVVGAGSVADVSELPHEVGVHGEPTGGIDDHDVVQLGLGVLASSPRHGNRVADAVARLRREHGDPGLLADDLQLVDCIGALEVGRDQERRVPLRSQVQGELAGEGRLAGALQSCEEDDGRAGLGEGEPSGLAAKDGDELLVDDLDDLLSGVQRPRHLGRQRPLLDRRAEQANNGQGDVGLEQGRADLPHRGIDIGLGQAALAAKALEGGGESVGQGGEHGRQRNLPRARLAPTVTLGRLTAGQRARWCAGRPCDPP